MTHTAHHTAKGTSHTMRRDVHSAAVRVSTNVANGISTHASGSHRSVRYVAPTNAKTAAKTLRNT